MQLEGAETAFWYWYSAVMSPAEYIAPSTSFRPAASAGRWNGS